MKKVRREIVGPPALERARDTTLADTSADAAVTNGATPRRAPAGTENVEVSLPSIRFCAGDSRAGYTR
jgi:hypothetical protein